MLKEAKLPLEFWDEAAEADAYQRNRIMKGPKARGGTDHKRHMSPEEAYTGEVPSIEHIRVWGSKCYSYLNPKTLPAKGRHDKFVDRGREGVFVGYINITS